MVLVICGGGSRGLCALMVEGVMGNIGYVTGCIGGDDYDFFLRRILVGLKGLVKLIDFRL